VLDLPDSVRDQPSPSARLIYVTLREADQPLTTDQVIAETGVSTTRCRRVLNTLLEDGHIESSRDCVDKRRKVWTVDLPTSGGETVDDAPS